MKVSDLAAKAFNITVKLRGLEFQYKPLSASVSNEIEAAFASQKPSAPLKPPPWAGSADYAKFVRDPTDGKYLADIAKYSNAVAAAKLAVSFGLESESGKKFDENDPARADWLKSMAVEFCKVVSEDEMEGLYEAISKQVKALGTGASLSGN